jgi:ABC-type transport system involved in multi-copper enzyme maturation permease subunit
LAIPVIARLTFLEAARRRILLAALLLGLAFLIVYGIGFYLITHEVGELPQGNEAVEVALRAQVYNFLTNMGLYAVNFLAIAMGALISADTLAGEITSGTIQAVVTKPVGRAEIVLGKALGFAGLLAMYLLLMGGGIIAIVYVEVGYVVPNAAAGLAIIYLESLLVMSVTLAGSSTFSTLATGGAVFGLYGLAFIGGWVEQIGAQLQSETAVNIGILSSLLLPSEALFRRAAYDMSSAIGRSLGLTTGPTFVVSVPSPLMIWYGVLYAAVMIGLAIRQFSRRDL